MGRPPPLALLLPIRPRRSSACPATAASSSPFPEMGAALDAQAPVIFVVWNNHGYREIEASMLDAGVEPVGVSPAPPDFCRIAEAYHMHAERLTSPDGLPSALMRARKIGKPCLIEIMVD